MNSKVTMWRPNDDVEIKRLQMSKALNASSAIDVQSPRDRSLFDYQVAGVEYALFTPRTLFADPPGVGKTIQSIGFINTKSLERILIICPASLTSVWARELKSWLRNTLRVDTYNPKTFDAKNPPDVLIVSYHWVSYIGAVREIIQRFPKYELCIIDECHFLKNPESLRTKHVLAANGLAKRAEFVHALSGTPLVNRPIELYPLIKSLCPQAIGDMNQFEFGIHFCGGFKSPWGWDFTGASNLKILGMKLRSHFMIRRKKEDVLTQLPDKFTPTLIYLDVSNKKSLVSKMEVFDDDYVIKRAPTADFEEISAIRHELGVSKIKAAAEYIKTQLEAGHEKILVFAHHKDVIEGIDKELEDYRVLKYVGGMSSKEKQDVVDTFQNDPDARIFLGSITAAGVGLTLTAASYVIFVEFSWVPGENEQCIDRLHRIGQRNGVMTDYLVVEDTLDERVLKYLLEKQRTIKEVFE